ncbi:MAG: LysM peptidoglycan-binding domain-containing protein [Acidimicrobiales bacterium]|jgi:Tfp pilus assembly protein FimV|nr:LysM peptidoglycan-binding domain-containing protein [Acidimicrobiales bacterium]HLV89672.1 LysM peptidoglycan-binding domain-containing protein [Acidimicrobiia bacterium]
MARTNQLSVRLSLLLVAVVAAFLLIGGAGADAGTPPVPPVEHVVRSGDTLWAIAAEHTAPGGDVRVTIDAIMRTTGMANSSLRPGQVLLIPRG